MDRETFKAALQILNDAEEEKPFCFIIGSGASRSSGIPTGWDMMVDWRKMLCQKSENAMRKQCQLAGVQWEEWERIRDLPEDDLPSEDYFPLYDLCYKISTQSGKTYLQKAMENAKPSQGYGFLAELMAKTEHKAVITTNFDDMVKNAFHDKHLGYYQQVDPDNALRLDFPLKYPLIAKLHGDLMLKPLNRSKELKKLADVWYENLPILFQNYIPIVIGYGGGDRTLMEYMKKSTKLDRVFWCSMKEKESDTIERFLDAEELRVLVPMDARGFDGIMEDIYKTLMPKEEEKRAEPPKQPKTVPPTPVPPKPVVTTQQPTPPPRKPLPVLSRDRLRAVYNTDTIEALVFRDTLAGAPKGALDLSEAGDGSVLCWRRDNTLTIAGKGGVAAPKSCQELFDSWTGLRTVTGAELLDTAGVTDMYRMFFGCSRLQALDVHNWNTAGVTNMCVMFDGCSSLQALDVSKWDTAGVTDMRRMFHGCSSLQALDVHNWNTAGVTDMCGMFRGCSGLQALDVGNWDTAGVTDMSWMFIGCSSLQALDVSKWNTANVTNMRGMFDGCRSLQALDVGNWNTANVTDMGWMFYDCRSLQTLDVGNWNTANVTYMRGMFTGTRWESDPPLPK